MKKQLTLIICAVLACLCIAATGRTETRAASAVTIGEIDYDELTMKIYKNGNSTIYFSASQAKTLSGWDEVSGTAGTDANGAFILTDISWASSTSDVTFYLRGDVTTTAVEVKLPKMPTGFKAIFDKVNGDFTFAGNEESDFFYYRKSTDYNWVPVSFSGAAPAGGITYDTFLARIEELRFKGAKLVLRLAQRKGVSVADPGVRPSKEITVTIAKYSSPPLIKLNITKLTLNTKTTMEWTDNLSGGWQTCEKNMEIADVAPNSLLKAGQTTGSQETTLYFRVEATEKKPCSQTMVLTVPAQTAAPTVGTADTCNVVYSYLDNKLNLTFKDASSTNMYEYCLVAAGDSFDGTKAKWRTVKNSKVIKLTEKAAGGATVYIRYKGTNANIKKNIALSLPSACASFVANGFEAKK